VRECENVRETKRDRESEKERENKQERVRKRERIRKCVRETGTTVRERGEGEIIEKREERENQEDRTVPELAEEQQLEQSLLAE
jgi:hypothetical protein